MDGNKVETVPTEFNRVFKVTRASREYSELVCIKDVGGSSSTILVLYVTVLLPWRFCIKESRGIEKDLRMKDGAPGPPKRRRAPFLTFCGTTPFVVTELFTLIPLT